MYVDKLSKLPNSPEAPTGGLAAATTQIGASGEPDTGAEAEEDYASGTMMIDRRREARDFE